MHWEKCLRAVRCTFYSNSSMQVLLRIWVGAYGRQLILLLETLFLCSEITNRIHSPWLQIILLELLIPQFLKASYPHSLYQSWMRTERFSHVPLCWSLTNKQLGLNLGVSENLVVGEDRKIGTNFSCTHMLWYTICVISSTRVMSLLTDAAQHQKGSNYDSNGKSLEANHLSE